MPRATSLVTGVCVFTSFLGVALAQAWPLPLHLTSALTGSPGGDTGAYVWNTWVFSHELRAHHHSPLSTESILALDGPADLSLHNYTVFSNLLALPLQPWLGVVASFNIVYLLHVALTGLGLFVLARRTWRAAGGGSAEAWFAALMFACSPFLVARSTAHFSLVAAAPLPFFVWCFDRAWESRRARDGAAAGLCLAWAAYCDVYYAVYCAALGLCLVAAQTLHVAVSPVWRYRGSPRWVVVLDVLIALLAGAVVLIGLVGGGAVQLGMVTISMRSLYTPVLILTTLVGVRLTIALRPRVAWTRPPAGLTVPAVAMVGAAAVLLSPVLYAIMVRTFEGRMVAAPVLWRSSAPGVDAIAWLMPNPNHPLAPRALVDWVSRQPGQYEENVSAIPWAALLVMVVAWRRAGHRPHRAWTAIGLFFASLAMGPFVRLAGINTFVPTPWAFLRYAPLIGDARMPARFSVIVVMAAAIVFAGALTAIVRRYPRRRAVVLATVGSALAFELLPAPRTLYSAEVPPVYDTVARDPRPLRVLELPFGIRDGLSSLGDFNASSLFFQTWHQKPLIGGYLSRVSEFHKAQYRSRPVMAALLAKSEGRSLARAEEDLARQTAKDFLREARIGWVIVDMNRASPALVQFAVETLRLTRLSQTGAFALYVPEESGLE